MSAVMEAYNSLMNRAAQGRPYVHSEVYYPEVGPDDPRTRRVVGHGHDFTRTVPVLDVSNDATVDGTAALRVLRLTAESEGEVLLLRARLTWTTSAGAEHASYACYKLTADAAAHLAQQPMTPPEENADEFDPNAFADAASAFLALTEALDPVFEDAERYRADWQQTFPGSDFDDSYYDSGEFDDEVARANEAYHSQAVRQATKDEPELLCMLSDGELGVVSPQELVGLWSWVSRQPK